MRQYKNIKQLMINKFKLENGLSVVIIPVHHSQIVSLNIAYRVGSKDEHQGKTGLAHLFEHLMFEGTKNHPKGEFDKLCAIAGGINNAYTTYDYTLYSMTLPANQLELGLYLESDRLFNFDISNEAFENQKNVVIEEIKQTVENQPYGRWRQEQSRIAFSKDCPYFWEVHGNINDLIKCNIENAKDFFKMFYKPSNASLVICGNINPHNTIKILKKYFNYSKNNEIKVRRNNFYPSHRLHKQSSIIKDNVPHPAVFISFHFDGFIYNESAESDIVANIIGGGKNSHLYKTLVLKKQIASAAGAFTDKREYSSLITFYAIANKKYDINILINEMLELIANIKKNNFSPPELNYAKNQLETSLSYELQRLAGIADYAAYYDLFWRQPEKINSIFELYECVNLNEVNKFVHNILNEDNSINVNVQPAE